MQTDSLFPDPPGGSACKAEHMGLIPALGRSQENGKAAHSNILDWQIPRTEEAWQATVHGLAWSQT